MATLSLADLHDLFRSNDGEDEVVELLNGCTGTSNDDIASSGLSNKYSQQTAEMEKAYVDYIQAHVDAVDSMCQLYREYTACEARVIDFETEIIAFQRQLRDTDDIVMIQQVIEDLLLRIKHRQAVSGALSEVYSAVEECDAFCQHILSSSAKRQQPVNDVYLSHLHRLGVKLNFLSRHKALRNSAVDDEIRPKLTAAAAQAGDKLYHYMSDRIQRLELGRGPSSSEPPPGVVEASRFSSITELHDSLRQEDNFGFTFLKLYNPSVAKRIVQLYIRHAAAYYAFQFDKGLHRLVEPGQRPPTGSSGNPFSRALSLSPSTIEDSFTIWQTGEMPNEQFSLLVSNAEDRLEAVVYLQILHRIYLKYGALHFSSEEGSDKEKNRKSIRWLTSFVKAFLLIVKSCSSECEFIAQFFCLAETENGAVEDYNDAEKVCKLVLEHLMGRVEASMASITKRSFTSPLEVLSALRVVDLCKERVCISQDPIPLLLLSGVFEYVKANLREGLQQWDWEGEVLTPLKRQLSLVEKMCGSSAGSLCSNSYRLPSFLADVLYCVWALNTLSTSNLDRASSFRGDTVKSSDSTIEKLCIKMSCTVEDYIEVISRDSSLCRVYLFLHGRILLSRQWRSGSVRSKQAFPLWRSGGAEQGAVLRLWDAQLHKTVRQWAQEELSRSSECSVGVDGSFSLMAVAPHWMELWRWRLEHSDAFATAPSQWPRESLDDSSLESFHLLTTSFLTCDWEKELSDFYHCLQAISGKAGMSSIDALNTLVPQTMLHIVVRDVTEVMSLFPEAYTLSAGVSSLSESAVEDDDKRSDETLSEKAQSISHCPFDANVLEKVAFSIIEETDGSPR